VVPLFQIYDKGNRDTPTGRVENAGDYDNGAFAVQSTNGLEIQEGEFPQNEPI
jgi:hypothetical protein